MRIPFSQVSSNSFAFPKCDRPEKTGFPSANDKILSNKYSWGDTILLGYIAVLNQVDHLISRERELATPVRIVNFIGSPNRAIAIP